MLRETLPDFAMANTPVKVCLEKSDGGKRRLKGYKITNSIKKMKRSYTLITVHTLQEEGGVTQSDEAVGYK